LPDPQGRRALGVHVATYLSAFIPALVWIAVETNTLRAVAFAALVAITHLVIDDGRLVGAWLARQHFFDAPERTRTSTDHSVHKALNLGHPA
jgi:hypothetical protein